MNSNELYRNVIFKGECIDSDDPLRLGRIRARLVPEDINAREDSSKQNGISPEPWSKKDPLVYLPLMPWFVNSPPKGRIENNEGEYVHLFFSNLDSFGTRDKYYIGGVYSSPTTSNFEGYESALTNLTAGGNNEPYDNILSKNGDINENQKGIYAEPEDLAIYGRGTADIVIQNNSVVLRAGKYQLPYTNSRQFPIKNSNRSFLQLSNYDIKKETLLGKDKATLNENVLPIKYLIEYDVLDPSNAEDLFAGNIYIYSISDEKIKTSIDINTNINESIKNAEVVIKYTNLSLRQTTDLITNTINNFINGNITPITNINNPNIEIVFTYQEVFNNQFPFYYRPRLSLYNQLTTSSNTQIINNIQNILNGVQVINGDIGYNIIYDNQKRTIPKTTLDKFKVNEKKVTFTPNSVSYLGGDEVYFISHQTQKFNKEPINIRDNIYNIDINKLTDEIKPKTSSLVRGEELIELLDLIIMFLVGHVHGYPGLPPDTTSTNEVTVEKLMTELRNARDKLLNSKIRIN